MAAWRKVGGLGSERRAAPADDRTLVALLAARDPRAMEVVYDRWCQLTYGLALQILEDRSTAEDVVLEVHLGLWRKPHGALDRHDSLRDYLCDMVRREARRRIAGRQPAG